MCHFLLDLADKFCWSGTTSSYINWIVDLQHGQFSVNCHSEVYFTVNSFLLEKDMTYTKFDTGLYSVQIFSLEGARSDLRGQGGMLYKALKPALNRFMLL